MKLNEFTKDMMDFYGQSRGYEEQIKKELLQIEKDELDLPYLFRLFQQ